MLDAEHRTQGKVERFNRTLKERVSLWVHGTPDDLRASSGRTNEEYNERPHEALKNVYPNAVYAGRKDAVLERRAKIRLETMARRYAYNMARTPEPQINLGQ